MSTAKSTSGRTKKQLIKGILAGMAVTKIAYFIPIVHFFGPILGGATTAFIINRGPWGGLKSGFLKGIGMTLPAIILGLYFAQVLADIPLIGDLLAGSLALIVFIIVAHSVILGMLGGFFSGFIAQKVRSAPVKEVAEKGTSAASETVKSAQNQAASGNGNSSKRCQTCGTTYTEDIDFCRECGTESPFSGSEDEDAAVDTQSDHDRSDTTHCRTCGVSVEPDVGFCPECGTESPLSDSNTDTDDHQPGRTAAVNSPPSSSAASTTHTGEPGSTDRTASTDPTATDGDTVAHAQSATTGSGTTDDRVDQVSTEETRGTNAEAVAAAVEAVTAQTDPTSETASELCRVLSDPTADEQQIQATLRDVVESIEHGTTAESTPPSSPVPEELTLLGSQPTTNQLEAARGSLARSDAAVAEHVVPIVDSVIELDDELTDAKTDRDQYRDALETIGQLASRSDAVSFRSTDPVERADELASALEQGELVVDSPDAGWKSIADDVSRARRPESTTARQLLDSIRAADDEELHSVLTETVDALDELEDLRAGAVDIEPRDVRRRIDSLESELQHSEGSVYRHLADRVRELEAMLETPDVDAVQLYAMYQECTFYDRTLIPRLSRTSDTNETVDVSRQIDEVESRIDAITDDYVAVRADHNHTIPNHFLDLADTLIDQSRQLGDREPKEAAGQLAATAALLDHIEALYTRNEYSVMLRRLRG